MEINLDDYIGTSWSGDGELWLDPAGNEASKYPCKLRFEDGKVSYSWEHEGDCIHGTLDLSNEHTTWVDSWHQKIPVTCLPVLDAWGLVTLFYTYGENNAANTPPWGWRITLSVRPDGTLVLQMTNIAPWGEEARAVRMVFSPDQR